MLFFLTFALFAGACLLGALLVSKGAKTWSTVVEGELVELAVDERVMDANYFSYTYDHPVIDQTETLLRFADGTEHRVMARLPDPGRRGFIRLQRNWLGMYRFEDPTP
jgi:hypothetical protein